MSVHLHLAFRYCLLQVAFEKFAWVISHGACAVRPGEIAKSRASKAPRPIISSALLYLYPAIIIDRRVRALQVHEIALRRFRIETRCWMYRTEVPSQPECSLVQSESTSRRSAINAAPCWPGCSAVVGQLSLEGIRETPSTSALWLLVRCKARTRRGGYEVRNPEARARVHLT